MLSPTHPDAIRERVAKAVERFRAGEFGNDLPDFITKLIMYHDICLRRELAPQKKEKNTK